MNVLQLAKYYPPVYGGIELVEKMMTKAHRENGDQMIICAFSGSVKEDTGEFGETVLRLKESFNLIGAPFSPEFCFRFKKIILSYKIHRIYVHLPNPFMHEIVLRHKKFLASHKVEVIAIYHSDIVNKSFLGALYSAYFRFTSKVYDRIVVSSKELWDSSSTLKPLPLEKRVVLPFCIEEAHVTKSQHPFKNKLISIGRLVPYKGFDFLINTFNNTEYELHIIGDGPLRAQLESMAAPNIKFHFKIGHEQKNQLLAESDVVVIGSRNRAEAFGMSIVESFSLAIPVVAPKLDTGVNFLVQNEKTGMVYEVENSAQLLSCVERLKNNPEYYKKLSEGCSRFYQENLTFGKFKEKLLNI